MLILLIRHGETDWNHQGRRQGRRDVPLNDQGREQMRSCAEQLTGLSPDAILTSPLSRAVESAEILADHLGVDRAAIRSENGLIERDFGDVDGMTQAELRAYRARGGNEKNEPLYLVRQRMMRSVLDVARKEKHKIVLVISHSAAIKSVMVRLYGKPELQRKTTKNAGISIVEYKGGRLHPRAFNLAPEEAARYLRRRGSMPGGKPKKSEDPN
jgi:broad specificity phosphatase PhoE